MRVQEMIAKLDIPVRQVMIEARIVEASDTFGSSLGVKLGRQPTSAVQGGDAGYGDRSGGNRVALRLPTRCTQRPGRAWAR